MLKFAETQLLRSTFEKHLISFYVALAGAKVRSGVMLEVVALVMLKFLETWLAQSTLGVVYLDTYVKSYIRKGAGWHRFLRWHKHKKQIQQKRKKSLW